MEEAVAVAQTLGVTAAISATLVPAVAMGVAMVAAVGATLVELVEILGAIATLGTLEIAEMTSWLAMDPEVAVDLAPVADLTMAVAAAAVVAVEISAPWAIAMAEAWEEGMERGLGEMKARRAERNIAFICVGCPTTATNRTSTNSLPHSSPSIAR